MTIKNKLIFSGTITILLIAILGFVLHLTSQRIVDARSKYEFVLVIQKAVLKIDFITMEYLIHREKGLEKRWNEKYRSTLELLKDHKHNGLFESIHSDFTILGHLFSQLTKNYKKRKGYIQKGVAQKYIDVTSLQGERLVSRAIIVSQAVLTNSSKLVNQLNSEVIAAQKLSTNLTYIVMGVLGLIVTLTSVFITRSISRPLEILAKGAERIGRGNLNHKIEISGKDEFTSLSISFNEMMKNLKLVTSSRDELNIEIMNRKEAEKKTEEVQKQLIASQKLAGIGELTAGVSHEVLNPVNIISVHTQMLQKKTKNDSNIQNFCNKVRHEIDRIQKIMNSLLAFSRKGQAKSEKGYLREEIEKTLALVEEEYKLDNIKIARNWCENCTEFFFDTDKMRQVYLNLLHNAKYAMPDGGTITVGCHTIESKGKQFLRLTFSDTGMGMSEEIRLKIFEPFFTTKPEGEGTGLGLAIVYGIIQEHYGKIRVESEEGKGTTFIMSLPLVRP